MRFALFAPLACAAVIFIGACAKGVEAADIGDAGLSTLPREGGTDGMSLPNPVTDGGPDDEDAGDDAGSEPQPTGTHVVINELLTGGSEFVELFNPTATAVDLSDWEVRYASDKGGAGPKHVFASGEKIPARGYVVLSVEDGSWTSGMAASAGQVGLFDDGGTRVDAVAYGAVTSGPAREGQSANSPDPDGSIGRSPNGVDTNDNRRDFKTFATPTPGQPN